MTVVAGYASTISVGGTPTAMTGEATSAYSGAGANTVRQITNSAKRVLDPSAAVTVKDGVSTVGASNYTLDYLYGKIRFSGYTPSGSITVDATYIPLLAVAGCRAFSGTFGRQALDATVFSNGTTPSGASWLMGKKHGAGDLEYIENLLNDQDPGAGSQVFWDYLNNATPKVLSCDFGSGGGGVRAWVLLHSVKENDAPDTVVPHKMSWQCTRHSSDLATWEFSEGYS